MYWVIVLICFLLIWIWQENRSIDVTAIEIKDDIPKGFDGYKIVQLSDFHNSKMGDKIIEKLKAIDCDIIVMTGDMVDSRNTDASGSVDFMKKAGEIAPCYYVTGNHEARAKSAYDEIVEEIKNFNVTVLDNKVCTLTKDGDEIKLVGIHDGGFDFSKSLGALLKETIKDEDGYKILLAHRPEYIDEYDNVDLILSGHAHGGQFNLPFIGAVFAPGQGFFPEFYAGLYEKDGKNMVVSRGLGQSLFPFRINNRFEIVVIELKGES